MTLPDALGRRAFLGLSAEQVSGAVVVSRVIDGGAASAARLEPGDRLVAIDEQEIRTVRDLTRRGRSIRAGAAVRFRIERGAPMSLEGAAPPYPAEPGTFLAHVTSRGVRLRTMFNLPSQPGRKPAVLLLQGVRADSCEAPFDEANPTRAAATAFASAGFVAMRVERSGVGDSEGEAPERTGLEVEVDMVRDAFDELCAFDEVDADRVFLFGSSFGGMMAPLLRRPVTGMCVVGTSARSWYECMLGTTMRQPDASGAPRWSPADLARWTKLFDLVLRERLTPAQAFARDADLLPLRSRECDGETMHGRHIALFQALNATDLRAAWREVRSRVLAIHGTGDWICTDEEGREIATLANGKFVSLGETSHEVNAAVIRTAIRWMLDDD
jgi:pimeloyl-ACP methyl ester carboxylesterase